MFLTRSLAILIVAVLAMAWCGGATANAAATGEKERLLNELDDIVGNQFQRVHDLFNYHHSNWFSKLMEDDGSIETALINYLFAKQVVDRLRKELDVTDLQRKRTYWKQCAFNAVSCFGK